MSQIKLIARVQECDTEILRVRKQLEELPEAAEIMECRSKRKEIKAKQDQVVELSDEAESKLAKLQKEEEGIVEKLKELQEKLDSTHDYRVTSSITRDMQGLVKRQGSLASEQDELLERQIKIDNLANQVREMLHKLDHKEEHLTQAFKEKGGALKEQIEQLSAERSALIVQVDEATAQRYEKIRAEKNGIGLSKLDGECCTVCRTTLLEGQLRKLAAGPALSECPNCHRLMVVREEEE